MAEQNEIGIVGLANVEKAGEAERTGGDFRRLLHFDLVDRLDNRTGPLGEGIIRVNALRHELQVMSRLSQITQVRLNQALIEQNLRLKPFEFGVGYGALADVD